MGNNAHSHKGTECKKHKVRCDQSPGQSSCARCKKYGYRCVSSNKLERIIEDDRDWKKEADTNIVQLQAAVTELLQQNGMPPLSSFPASLTELGDYDRLKAGFTAATAVKDSRDIRTRETSQEPTAEQELVSAPMRSLFEVTKLRNIRSDVPQHRIARTPEDDLISRGALPHHVARELFSFFDTTMNHILWGGIALIHRDLESARRSSSLLCAAILAVAALHFPQGDEIFEFCYSEFVSLVSGSIIYRDHNLDDIRALCIGAFWLPDLSWKLSGVAVRIATELNLHQAFHKMQRGEPDQYERAQLWYLLYVCDHHYSIAYGRPPVIHDNAAIKGYESFLSTPLAGPADMRLMAQVALFITLTNAYHTFGSDGQQPLNEEDFNTDQTDNSAPNPYVGTYPSKGVVLHYHFAKLQLNSLALRAISPNHQFSLDRREAANSAIASAMSTMNLVLHEPDIRNAVARVTLFKHTMVAFAAVFLLKVVWSWNSASLNIDRRQVLELVQAVVDLLSGVQASRRHLCRYIATGLSKMISRLKSKPLSQPRHDADGAINISGGIDDDSYGSMSENVSDALGFEDDWMLTSSIDPFCFSIT
ncbi:Fungal Zn2-Cys6 binuclear cluster domain-containing protein [Cladophialophora immunda]|nr:Fungal Zn2-Cys6 binuclear cluster domain-containing protein [Cladophialophora immunda]